MNTDTVKQLCDEALGRLATALEQGQSDALKTYLATKLQELAQSIRAQGVLVPLIVGTWQRSSSRGRCHIKCEQCRPKARQFKALPRRRRNSDGQ